MIAFRANPVRVSTFAAGKLRNMVIKRTKEAELDRIDRAILRELAQDGRISHADLSERVGLSSTACARRIAALEDEGLLRGYQAVLDLSRLGLSTTVIVRIALDSQSEEALDAFEHAVAKSPSVLRCFLMSGSDDYLVTLLARDLEDFGRIHRTELSRLPHIARIQSSFALREVVNRRVPASLFEPR
jgi:Lrp/AsnC family leucine-responsive transcriptional regulator